MITSLAVRNWKAYDELDIELGPGSTFLVARNGVGKTSFIEAVLWGLLGSAASRIDGDAARRGDRPATVTMELQLPRRGTVKLTRTVSAASGRGRAKEDITYTHGGVSAQGEASWNALLSDEWQASPTLLGRLLVLPEHAVWEELSSPAGADINAAIRALLRLDALASLTTSAGMEFRKAEKSAKDARAVSARELQDARASEAAAVAAHAEGNAEVEALRAAFAARAAQARYAEARATWEVERGSWLQQQEEIREQMAQIAREMFASTPELATHDNSDEVVATSPLDAVSHALEQIDAQLASSRALDEITNRHLQELGSDQDCPVCLRPMDRTTVEAAGERHAALLRELADRITGLERLRDRLLAARAALTTLQQQLSIPMPSEPTQPATSEPEVAANVATQDMSDEELLDAGRAAAERAEQLRDALGVARSSLVALEDRDRAWSTALSAYRRQGLSRLVSGTSERLTDALTAQAADPLLRLVREQWKKLPLGEALDIDNDGKISVVRNGRRLDYRCLSGGEKAQVVLLYRVAALKALSEVPVLLLDEPLEHLDPRNRWRFGRMVTSLASSGALGQILLTTYEEPLARRLAYQAGQREQPADVTLRYLSDE